MRSDGAFCRAFTATGRPDGARISLDFVSVAFSEVRGDVLDSSWVSRDHFWKVCIDGFLVQFWKKTFSSLYYQYAYIVIQVTKCHQKCSETRFCKKFCFFGKVQTKTFRMSSKTLSYDTNSPMYLQLFISMKIGVSWQNDRKCPEVPKFLMQRSFKSFSWVKH